jgi:hypothetical protein
VIQRPVHLLIDGYRQIACGGGDGAPSGDGDTSNIAKVTCLACLNRGFKMYEALTEAIAMRLVELGATPL